MPVEVYEILGVYEGLDVDEHCMQANTPPMEAAPSFTPYSTCEVSSALNGLPHAKCAASTRVYNEHLRWISQLCETSCESRSFSLFVHAPFLQGAKEPPALPPNPVDASFPEAPTFYPNIDEFRDPLRYVRTQLMISEYW